MIFLHGFTGGPSSFADVVAGLGGSAFAPLLTGHGSAPSFTASGRFDDAVDDLARAIPSTEPVTVVGYSMGARLALRLLVRHPHRIARAVLVGVHPGIDDEAAREERRRWEAGLAETLVTRGVPAFVDEWERLPVLRTVRAVPPERLARRRAARLGHTAHGLAHALAVLGLAAMPATAAALPHVDVPVTLVAGAEDQKHLAVAQHMATRMPAARVVAVPACGHDVALEAPEELIEILGGHA